MEHTVVTISGGEVRKSEPTSKAEAFEKVSALQALGVVAWVEDAENNIVWDMTPDEILEREA